jgi:hypothetical protein
MIDEMCASVKHKVHGVCDKEGVAVGAVIR